MRARLPLSVIGAALLAVVVTRCLPPDTRPPPAVLHITVEPSDAVTKGFTTDDGWHISFERLLVSLAGAGFTAYGTGDRDADDSACNDYSDSRYERLFDLTMGGQQKLVDMYGLGLCGVRLRLRSPGMDALRGKGISDSDLAFMRAQDTDAVVTNRPRSVFVRGMASREAVTKRFEWSFRLGFTLHGCARASGAGFASDLVLARNEVLPLPVIVRGEELFRERADDESPLRFEAIAAADTDGDQVITLDELAAVPGPLPDVDGGETAGDGGAPTLEQLIYEELVPRMVRPGDSGPCRRDPQSM